jgi:hypothetical protein
VLRRLAGLAAFTVAFALFGGCVTSVSSELHQVRGAIDDGLPGVRLEREATFHVGRFAFAVSRGILRAAGEREIAGGVLSGLRRVDVGVFHVEGGEALVGRELVHRVDSILVRRGWVVMIRQLDDGEATWVTYRTEGDEIRGFYVIALDGSELSLVRLRGRLDRALAAAIAAANG